MLFDHVRYGASSNRLRELIEPFGQLSLAVCPTVPPFAILDGTSAEVHVEVGFSTLWRAEWHTSRPPDQWADLVRIASALLDYFATCVATEPAIEAAQA